MDFFPSQIAIQHEKYARLRESFGIVFRVEVKLVCVSINKEPLTFFLLHVRSVVKILVI